jgi:arsenate reductase
LRKEPVLNKFLTLFAYNIVSERIWRERMERKILFLCTGNSARSQMGEALLRKYAGHVFEVYSAGTEPGVTVFPPVVEAMKEIGIDISAQKPKGFDKFLGHLRFEKVIIVCSEAEKKCPGIFGPAQRLLWPFDDPAAAAGSPEDILVFTRNIRDQIRDRILKWLEEQGITPRM